MLAEEGETPQALLDRPEIEMQLQPFWEAFSELSTDRPIDGMGGAGAIPFSAIDRYADRYGFGQADEFERFRALIRAMDAAYLKARGERREKGKAG